MASYNEPVRKWKLVLACFLGLGLAAIWAYWNEFYGWNPWTPVSLKVTVDGRQMAASGYRQGNELAVHVQGDQTRIYILEADQPNQVVLASNCSVKFDRLWFRPGCAKGIVMITGGDVKTEVDPKVEWRQGSASFTDVEKRRIQVWLP